MSEWNPEANEIFLKAIDCESSESRQAYLDGVCGSDGDLRAQVESLLEADSKATSFLEEPVAGDRPTEVLQALSDTERLPDGGDLPPDEISLDFLQPCDVPDRLGKLGQYEVMDVIGRGGMGVVLRAHDPKLNRVVAVKVLAPEFAANPTARRRFLREARAAAAVSHPHVVTIHAVEEADSTPYLVMECIDGQSLQDKIKRDGTLQLEEILRIGSQIAAGLVAAHGQGLIHRDVKPGNILLENGVERVKITDFGLARAVDDIGITRTGEVAGTPEFMSPEQAQGLAVEHRSDLFSLGSVLYAMCTGRSPFRADTTVAVLRRVCDDVPRPIREVNPEIPEGLVAIIDRLLAKTPDERFQTAEEVAELLGEHLACLQHPTKAPPSGPHLATDPKQEQALSDARRRPPWWRDWRKLTAGAGGLLLIWLAVWVIIRDKEGKEVARFRLPEGGSVTEGPDGRPYEPVPWTDVLPADAPPPAVAPFDEAAAKAHQQAWADYLGLPVEREIGLSGGEKLTLVLIPPGEFLMGASEEEQTRFLEEALAAGHWAADRIPTERPQHPVKITRPFYLGKYEVTQAQWEALSGDNPSEVIAPLNPVERVSWEETQPLLEQLSQEHAQAGIKFALPTEAQWEYACRAGTTTAWHCGDTEDSLAEFANPTGAPCPVGQFRPNPWGLYDMHGNVWEWCADWHGEDYYAESPPSDPSGSPSGSRRVNRGGSWYHRGMFCRSAFRNHGQPGGRDVKLGLRLAAVLLDADEAKKNQEAEQQSSQREPNMEPAEQR